MACILDELATLLGKVANHSKFSDFKDTIKGIKSNVELVKEMQSGTASFENYTSKEFSLHGSKLSIKGVPIENYIIKYAIASEKSKLNNIAEPDSAVLNRLKDLQKYEKIVNERIKVLGDKSIKNIPSEFRRDGKYSLSGMVIPYSKELVVKTKEGIRKALESNKNAYTVLVEVGKPFKTTGNTHNPLAYVYTQALNELRKEFTSKSLKASEELLDEVIISEKELKEITKANEAYTGKIVEGKNFEYDPDSGVITVVPINKDIDEKMYAVYLSHEIKHAMTYDWLKNNQNSQEVRYLLGAIKTAYNKVTTSNDMMTLEKGLLKNRLEYAHNQLNYESPQNELRAVAELVAILSSEPNIRKSFTEEFPQEQISKLEQILNKIKEYLGVHSVKLGTSNTIQIVDNIVDRNKPNLSNSKSNVGKITHEKDFNKTAQEDAARLC